MKPDKVTYQKVFPLSPYVNEKIGIEIQLEEYDNPEYCLDFAKEIVEGWHKKRNPHLIDEPAIYQSEVPTINLKDQDREILIDNATSVEELGKLRPGLPSDLVPFFMKKMKELTDKIK
jgi:hypothetical protein